MLLELADPLLSAFLLPLGLFHVDFLLEVSMKECGLQSSWFISQSSAALMWSTVCMDSIRAMGAYVSV
jgi:hypothetical protein